MSPNGTALITNKNCLHNFIFKYFFDERGKSEKSEQMSDCKFLLSDGLQR